MAFYMAAQGSSLLVVTQVGATEHDIMTLFFSPKVMFGFVQKELRLSRHCRSKLVLDILRRIERTDSLKPALM